MIPAVDPSRLRRLVACALALLALRAGAEDFLDRVGEALTYSALEGEFRARVSGTLDLEGYRLQQPSPGLLFTESKTLYNPRLTLFVDAQWGRHGYAFVQTRADRGFDPSSEPVHLRVDEYAIRLSFADQHVNVQIGKFGTLLGNWVPRHGSWEQPFITAPLPYENLTAVWDNAAARSSGTLLGWAHLGARANSAEEQAEKPLRAPIVWGPSYTQGAAIFGNVGRFRYAFELKSGALSSRPETWNMSEDDWRHPTFGARLGYRPNEMWSFGTSASTGPYLRELATPTLFAETGRGDYRQTVLAQDVSFAWHRMQFWAEVYAARFAIPQVGDAETLAYYAEGKYKFTPRLFAALRWNQQMFGTIPDGRGGQARWGRESWRIDVAPTFRFTPHHLIKLQYSLQHESNARRAYGHLFASQLVVRF